MDRHENAPSLQDSEEFSICRTLGRIESAVSNMASDIHDAVLAQRATVERLDRDELRLYSLEGWRESVRDRNTLALKVFLVLLLPSLAGLWSGGTYLVKLSQELSLHEQTFIHTKKK